MWHSGRCIELGSPIHNNKLLSGFAFNLNLRPYTEAGPGLKAADLAKLAKSGRPKDNAAVLEWQSKAATAAEELRLLQGRAQQSDEARGELEEELRGRGLHSSTLRINLSTFC